MATEVRISFVDKETGELDSEQGNLYLNAKGEVLYVEWTGIGQCTDAWVRNDLAARIEIVTVQQQR